MQKPQNLFLVISLLLFAFSAPAFAQMAEMGGGSHAGEAQHEKMSHGKGMPGDSCWTETLTDEQRAKIGKMKLEYKKAKSLLKAQITVKKVELATLVAEDSPNQSTIDKKIDEILELKKEKMQKKYAFKIALRKILTPQQRVLFDMKMLKKALHGEDHGSKKYHRNQ